MQMNRFLISLILAGYCFLLILANPLTAAVKTDSVSLDYSLDQGQEFKLVYYMNNLIQTEAMGFSLSITQGMDMYYTTRVAGTDKGQYTLTNTIDRISIDQEAMGMKASYDSESISEPATQMGQELKKAMDQLVGQVITMEIDHKGHVVSSDYVDVFSQASSGGMFTFDNSQSWYAVFPEKKLIPGDSWEYTLQLGDEDYAFNSITTYTLQSLKKKKAVLEISTVYESIEGSKMKGISGTSTRTMVIDPKTGMPVSGEMTQKIELTVEEEDIKVPVKLSVDIRMERLE